MKVDVKEYRESFVIHLEAENMQEAATLTRLGMNSRKEIRSSETMAAEAGSFINVTVFAKTKRASSYIPRSK